jgi:cytochrome b561
MFLIFNSIKEEPVDISENPSLDYSQNSKTSGDFEDRNRNVMSSLIIQTRPCEECHGEFYPFEVQADIFGDAGSGQLFEYKILVSNSDKDKEHNVEDLSATITGIGEISNEPYNNAISGSARRFSSSQHSFPVEQSAFEVIITLTGDSGILNRNDLNLVVRSPDGQTWSSSGTGVDEEIILEMNDISEGGFGDYTAVVQYVAGVGAISYSITIDVSYISPELHRTGDDLKPGDSYTFSWDLALTDEDLNNLGSEVSGTVSYEHEDGIVETYRYNLEVKPGTIIKGGSEGALNFNLEYGRIMGLLSLGLLIAILITSLSKTSRKILAKPFKLKNPQTAHCYFSLSIFLFALIHSSLLLQARYSWNATPSILGFSALAIFGIITIEGFSRQKIIDRIGKKRWKWLHRSITASVVLIVAYHALTFGEHFFG